MREILFKAKRVDTGEWVEGSLVLSNDAEEGWEAIIIPNRHNNMFTKGGSKGDLGFENWYRVDKNTICQYTGLTDKNGNKIWENDVIIHKRLKAKGKVAFMEDTYVLDEEHYGKQYINGMWNAFEVIGNIFDNPELLKGE